MTSLGQYCTCTYLFCLSQFKSKEEFLREFEDQSLYFIYHSLNGSEVELIPDGRNITVK